MDDEYLTPKAPIPDTLRETCYTRLFPMVRKVKGEYTQAPIL